MPTDLRRARAHASRACALHSVNNDPESVVVVLLPVAVRKLASLRTRPVYDHTLARVVQVDDAYDIVSYEYIETPVARAAHPDVERARAALESRLCADATLDTRNFVATRATRCAVQRFFAHEARAILRKHDNDDAVNLQASYRLQPETIRSTNVVTLSRDDRSRFAPATLDPSRDEAQADPLTHEERQLVRTQCTKRLLPPNCDVAKRRQT